MFGFIGAAQAVDLGLGASYNFGGPDRPALVLSVGQKVTDKIGIEASVERADRGDNDQIRYGVTGSYDITKVAGVTLSGKVGAAYLDNQYSQNGWVGTVGVGASYPLTKAFALTADYRYQRGEGKVDAFNGNTVLAGVKLSF